ncbi:MAG: hypothetical protein WA175_10805 [Candidatus Acidiferrales bacterium]
MNAVIAERFARFVNFLHILSGFSKLQGSLSLAIKGAKIPADCGMATAEDSAYFVGAGFQGESLQSSGGMVTRVP